MCSHQSTWPATAFAYPLRSASPSFLQNSGSIRNFSLRLYFLLPSTLVPSDWALVDYTSLRVFHRCHLWKTSLRTRSHQQGQEKKASPERSGWQSCSSSVRVPYIFKRARSLLGENVVEDMNLKGHPLLAQLTETFSSWKAVELRIYHLLVLSHLLGSCFFLRTGS